MSKQPSIYRRGEGDANNRGKALQLGRRVTAVVALTLMTVYFVLLGTSAAIKFQWITRVQIVPAILSVSGSLILLWTAVTLLFGRVYCSMACPVGIVQDIAARLPRLGRKKQFRRSYRYHEPHNRFRYTWLALIAASAVAGLSLLLALFDPYGTFGRIMTYLLQPLIASGNGPAMATGVIASMAVAAIALAAIVLIPFKRGRLICNTVCPVGSVLSVLGRHSVFGMDINTDACVNCGLCARVCKAECINATEHTVDMSRCVVCFNCTAVCDSGAITYTRRRHRLSIPMLMKAPGERAAATIDAPASPDAIDAANEPADNENAPRPIDRRRFITSGIILAAAPVVASAADKLDRFRPLVIDQAPTTDLRPVPPPGAASGRAFLSHCVGCGACIAACPAHVLVPSATEHGVANALHPMKNYDDSYCRYNCVRCTEVCPTGALQRLTVEEKHQYTVGFAQVDAAACIGCGMCARRCPQSTIAMQKVDGKRIAVVDTDGCIGCGSCQYICPASPHKAIKVNGIV